MRICFEIVVFFSFFVPLRASALYICLLQLKITICRVEHEFVVSANWLFMLPESASICQHLFPTW